MSQTPCSTSAKGQDCTYRSTDGLSLHYVDYPTGGNGVPVLCLHGLSRNSRDFADLAAHLSTSRRVLCADFRGRGLSEWDPNPDHYDAPVYVADIFTLMDHVKLDRVIVIGTSLGGIIGAGMMQMRPGLIAGMVLNDIGPVIDPAGLARIGGYIGENDQWTDWDDAVNTLKKVNAVVYPDFTHEDWLNFVRNTCRIKEDGKVVQDYDPAIAQAFADDCTSDLDLWPLFETLGSAPALLVRGALSDLLSAETAREMTKRVSDLNLVIVENRGHVPTLTEPAALSAIEAFVEQVDSLKNQRT